MAENFTYRANKLHEISGNLTKYFHLAHSITYEFVNWPLISLHDVRLCLKLLTEIKRCREHGTLIFIIRFPFVERERENERERERERERGKRGGDGEINRCIDRLTGVILMVPHLVYYSYV